MLIYIIKKETFMHVCFLMYPWERIDPEWDSTLRLIHECAKRDHFIAITSPNNLTIRKSASYAFCKVLKKNSKISASAPNFYKKAQFTEKMLPMSGFDVIFMRDNPPLDPVMLNFLDSVQKDTFIINSVEGLRKANNKLYPASFYDPKNEIIPATHVSKNKDYLKRVIEESETDKMILKPFDGYGGKGVIILEKDAKHNVNSLLDFYINQNDKHQYVILQEYIEGAEKGDVRVLMLNGEPIGAMKRVPSPDDLRSNIHIGGKAVKHVLSKKEKEICSRIGQKLREDGLYFVGLDIINDKLIEVNVCSPGGISRINQLNRTKLQVKIIDFCEKVASHNSTELERKRAIKKELEDAKAFD